MPQFQFGMIVFLFGMIAVTSSCRLIYGKVVFNKKTMAAFGNVKKLNL